MSRSAEAGGGYCSFSWKVPHFSQTFIMRGQLMITWAQMSSPPHWHVPTLFRAAPWRATFCTLLSAISSRSFLLPLAAPTGVLSGEHYLLRKKEAGNRT
jgi:hypothetical protein